MGSAPSTTRMARNSVSGPLGLRKPGGCTTTGFALCGLSKKYPAITIPIENVTDFFAGHLASDHQLITAKLWPDIASKLEAPGRWSRVFGHFRRLLPHYMTLTGLCLASLNGPALMEHCGSLIFQPLT